MASSRCRCRLAAVKHLVRDGASGECELLCGERDRERNASDSFPSIGHVDSDRAAEADRDHILKVLEESNWVLGGRSGAAARLAVKRTTLIAKMKKCGVSGDMARGR